MAELNRQSDTSGGAASTTPRRPQRGVARPPTGRRRRRRRGWAAGLAMVALVFALPAAACGDDDDDDDGGAQGTTTAQEGTTTSEGDTTPSGEAPARQHDVSAYFLRDEHVGPVAREATGPAVAAGALRGLLAGPTDAERALGFGTAIPAGTTLNGVVVADGVATVDLSGDFASGGGSASMQARVAQVVFTLTQFPTVDSVDFELDGEPLTALGGEGLLLEEPQTRADWEDLSPAILVERPLPFAQVASPLRITGTANTFEAVFRVKVTDASGRVVYDERAMATSGTGTRGTFDVTARFGSAEAGTGELTVFEPSARDGSPTNVVTIPIRLS